LKILKTTRHILILLATATLIACSTVPLINRKQVLLVPQSEMLAMSHSSYRQFLDTNDVTTTTKDAKRIQTIGNNISSAVESFLTEKGLENRIKQFSWEFNLVNDQTPNAWCIPGGKVVFYSGILPYCDTDEGIAVVMAHEIAHAVARHGNERMSQNLMVSMGGMALSEFINEKPQETQQLFLSAFAIGSQVGVLLPYSRKHEYEADKLGLIFMAMAGYNPQEAVNFWERMMNSGGVKPPEFLSTHPADKNRIEAMQKAMPEAMKYYEASKQ
jgi:predicted Zn-dependent protease